MKRLFSLLLVLALLLSSAFVFADLLSETEKEEKLYAAVEIVEAYLESPRENISLEPAEELLEQIGNYNGIAQNFLAYTKILRMLAKDDDSFLLGFYFETVKDPAFTAFLNDIAKEHPAFADVETLSVYRDGRAAERAGDIGAAAACYVKCGGFYDSLDRVIAMFNGIYEEAVRLMNAGSLKEAYLLFQKCAGYGDSEARMQEIVSRLGYDPTHEHQWAAATCTLPATCTVCGVTEGSPLGHSWQGATCTAPKTCTVCGMTEGTVSGHQWLPATHKQPETCALCGLTRGEPAVLRIGDVVSFGAYQQDNDIENGMEEIEWQVLAIRDDRALLFSLYSLDCRAYHTTRADIAWADCSLRTWLNEEFAERAFSTEEQDAILLTEVENDREQGRREWKKNGGKNTVEKLFLLSYAEFDLYLGYDCAPAVATKYARSREYSYGNSTRWWLRSPGKEKNSAAIVEPNASVFYDDVTFLRGIRPAMWVNISAIR